MTVHLHLLIMDGGHMGAPSRARDLSGGSDPMFLSMEILAGDLSRFEPKVFIADSESSRNIRYVVPAGDMVLDDGHALYAVTASRLEEVVAKAGPLMNVLCVGSADGAAVGAHDDVNVMVLDVDESMFDAAVQECAKAISWYADGLLQLTQAVDKGDEEAIRRATALLRYCLEEDSFKDQDPSALAEQLDMLLHRNITSWQLLEDAISDWGWNILDEYLVVSAALPDRSSRRLLSVLQPKTLSKPPTHVFLPQEEHLVVVLNLTHMDREWRTVAADIAEEILKVSGDARIGASNPFSELQDLYYYGQQAKTALELGSSLERKEPVTFFHDVFLDFVALRCLEACPPTSLFPPGYSRLRNYEHDHPRSSSLLRFLDTYISNDFQMKPTIAAEYCSRTTAFDKLKRIKQISGMDLDDPNTRAALRIATHAIRLSKISPSQPRK